MSILKEAFQELELLDDTFYDIDDKEDIEKLQKSLDSDVDDELDDVEMIVDLEADDEEDLKDSYVGQVLLFCPVCHTIHYAKKEEVIPSEENPELVNVEEHCPHCDEVGGFEVVGEVAPYGEDETASEDEPTEDNEEKGEKSFLNRLVDDDMTPSDLDDDENPLELDDSDDFEESYGSKAFKKKINENRKAKATKKSLKESKNLKEERHIYKDCDGEIQAYNDWGVNYIETYKDKAVIVQDENDEDRYTIWSTSWNRPLSRFRQDNSLEPIWFNSIEEVKQYIDNRDKNENLDESKLVEEPVYRLNPRYDSRKSFYGKAQVDTGDKGDQNKLYSYDTLVAEIKDGKPVVYGTYSQTTLRHIKDWLKQNGFKAETLKQIMNDYGVKEESCGKKLKEEVQDEAYAIADYVEGVFQDRADGKPYTMYRDEFEEQVALACRELYGIDNVYENVDELGNVEINGKSFNIDELLDGDIRGILSYDGIATDFSNGDLTTEEIDENLKENQELDEKLPKDLAKAYKRVNKDHSYDMGVKDARREVRTDYENSNYTEVSPEEAMELKKQGKLGDVRLIIDGEAVKFDANGNPLNSFTVNWKNEYETKNGVTKDKVRQMPLSHLFKIADKIYVTDEAEHSTRTEGEWVKDEKGDYKWNITKDNPIAAKRRQQRDNDIDDTGRHSTSFEKGQAQDYQNYAKGNEKRVKEYEDKLAKLEKSYEDGDISRKQYESDKASYLNSIETYKKYAQQDKKRSGDYFQRYRNTRADRTFAASNKNLQAGIEKFRDLKNDIRNAKYHLDDLKRNGVSWYNLNGGSYERNNEEINSIKAEISRLQNKLADLEKANVGLQDANAKQNAQALADAEQNITNLQNELDTLLKRKKESLDRKTQVVKNLKERLDEKKTRPLTESRADAENFIDSLIEYAQDSIDNGSDIDTAIAETIDSQLIYSSDILDLANYYGVLDDSELIDKFIDSLYSDIYSGVHEKELSYEDKLEEYGLPEEEYYSFEEIADAESLEIEDLKEMDEDELRDHIADTFEYNYDYKTEDFDFTVDDDGVNVTNITWDLDESLKESTKQDDIDAKADDKKEVAKKDYEKEVDDADADKDDEFDEIDESLFDNLVNKYCVRVYENVDNYKTTKAGTRDDKIILEGLLTYKSGNTLNTKFIFEKLVDKKGTNKFVGINETFSKGKKAFTLNYKVDNKKLISESLQYNYKVKVDNSNKAIYGRVENK